MIKDETKQVKVGPSESMSKSKKNIIDPQKIIQHYGADAVRLFILSDSPPEKDVQWSEEGIKSCYKFMQKLWSLDLKVNEELSKNHQKGSNESLEKFTNQFVNKMTKSLENFSYNIIVANLHQMYSFLNKNLESKFDRETLAINYEKILITLMPIIPHFTSECLTILKGEIISPKWPAVDTKFLLDGEINYVVQFNGKKRGIIKAEHNINQEKLMNLIEIDSTLKKYLSNKDMLKIIFIPNKLINIILP